MRTRIPVTLGLPVVLTLLVGAVVFAQSPAMAGRCDAIEQLYGLTASAELVERHYCVGSPGGFLPPRTIANLDGSGLRALFWGGLRRDETSVFYGVTADGGLMWFDQNPDTGALGSGIRVGAQFGDWGRYQDLTATGNGDLQGRDTQGHLVRWTHVGWRDGSDTWWAGPEDLGPGCTDVRPVYVGRDGPDLYVGISPDPPGYVYCAKAGVARTASLLPKAQLAASATSAPEPGVTFALAGDTVVRLVLSTRLTTPLWRPAASIDTGYVAIFAGRTIAVGVPQPYKYEWQWPFYGEYPEK
jgi:hypothetical protein